MNISTTKKAVKKTAARKPAARKPAVKKPLAKAVAKQVKITTVYCMSPSTKNRMEYFGSMMKRQYTIAAFLVASMVDCGDSLATGANSPAKALKGGDMALWKFIVGDTAPNYWKKGGRVVSAALTKVGTDTINDSFAGIAKGGYNATPINVNKLKGVILKGGKVKIGDTTYDFKYKCDMPS